MNNTVQFYRAGLPRWQNI